MREKVIQGLTREETQEVLKKVSFLIDENEKLDEKEDKFGKEGNDTGEIEGLSFSVRRDEKGQYFLLGNRKNSKLGHLLGQGATSEVRLAYVLEKQNDGSYELGQECVVKRSKFDPEQIEPEFKYGNDKKYKRIVKYEDPNATRLYTGEGKY